jgi:CRP-like cAMP-binding protein
MRRRARRVPPPPNRQDDRPRPPADFSVLVPEVLARIGYEPHRRRYKQWQVIASAGTHVEDLLLVIKGRVNVVHNTPAGQSLMVRTVGPNTFVAEQSLLGMPLTGDLVAGEPTELWVISTSAFRAAIGHEPLLAGHMLTAFAQELAIAENRMVELSVHNVRQRVAGILLRVAALWGTSTIQPPRGWTRVAAYLGTTPETISRQLHDLAREGIIRMVDQNTITILDPERLEQTAQG